MPAGSVLGSAAHLRCMNETSRSAAMAAMAAEYSLRAREARVEQGLPYRIEDTDTLSTIAKSLTPLAHPEAS